MHDLKRRVLAYLDADRVRLGRHFHSRARQRQTTRADAERVLRNGAVDPRRCEGENIAIVGTDTKDRRVCVTVRIDATADILVLVTAFQIRQGR